MPLYLGGHCSEYFGLSNLPEQMVPSGKPWKVLGVWFCLVPPSLLGSQVTSQQTSFLLLEVADPGLQGLVPGTAETLAVGSSSGSPVPQRALVLG